MTAYSEEELELQEEASKTDLTPELVLARIMLCRLFKAAPAPYGDGTLEMVHWFELVDRFLGRIGKLVVQHCRVEGRSSREIFTSCWIASSGTNTSCTTRGRFSERQE